MKRRDPSWQVDPASRSLPPTDGQLRYILELRWNLGIEGPQPKTRGDAEEMIWTLRAMKPQRE